MDVSIAIPATKFKALFNLRVLIAACIFTGCTYEDSRCPAYPMEHFQRLEDELTEAWPEDYELYLGSITKVECIDEGPVARNGAKFKWGLTQLEDNNEVSIFIRKLPTLRMTAYVHELVHVGLWEATGTFDPDHSEGDGPWKKKHDDVILKLWGL